MLQVANNKRYAAASGKGFTVTEVAQHVKDDVGKIDILVHSLANGPEVTKPLLETSRRVSFHNQWVCIHVKQNRLDTSHNLVQQADICAENAP